MLRLEQYGAEIFTDDGTLKTGTVESVNFADGRMTVHPYPGISRRLTQALLLRAIGLPQMEIVRELGISKGAVSIYLSNVSATLHTLTDEQSVNRSFDDDIGIFRPDPDHPAVIPDGAQRDMGFISKMASGLDVRELAAERNRIGLWTAPQDISDRAEEIAASFGVQSMTAVITVCRMAGVSIAPPA